ncbi:MAG: hypothetical protein QF752_05605 [Planctomycetota bacterium]|jgi:hypothetical protein|nr:hypothetical protein [Planctomycetota bacterium]
MGVNKKTGIVVLVMMIGLNPMVTGQEQKEFEKTPEVENPFRQIEKGEIQPKSAPEATPERSDEDKKKEGEEVRRNIEHALQNYRQIQESQSESRVRNLDRRIQENERLLKRNQTALTNYQERVRKAKLNYIRELLALKGARKAKSITQEVYEERLRSLANEYEFRIGQLDRDIDYYRKEADSSGDRLENLQEQNRIYQMASRRTRAIEKKKLPLSRLELLQQQLENAHQFELQDVWDGSDWRFFQIR